MSPYEIVRRAIEFQVPERLPIRFGTLGLVELDKKQVMLDAFLEADPYGVKRET